MFLEKYSDSPEFTHVDNPVVYMEKEILPEERKHHKDRPRRHPLSQVMTADDTNAVPESSQVGKVPTSTEPDQKGEVHAPIAISNDDDEQIFIDEDEELGEPEDDTFEFLLK